VINLLKPKVSIIVPLFNAEHFMRTCVDSVLNQTLREIEVILVNDGSHDLSGVIAEEYAMRDSRIKVIHQANKGPGSARNQGIREATGEYVGFVDSDDWIETTMYDSLYAAAIQGEACIAMCDFIEEFPKSNIKRKKYIPLHSGEVLGEESIREKILTSFAKNSGIYYASMSNKLYKRKWLLQNNLFSVENRDIAEDWLFNIDAFCQANRAVYVHGLFYHYMHINSSSLMYKYRPNQFHLKLESRRNLKDKLRKRGVNLLSYKQEMDTRFCLEAIGCMFSEVQAKQKWANKIQKISEIIHNPEVKSALMNCKSNLLHIKCILWLTKYRFETLVFVAFSVWCALSTIKAALSHLKRQLINPLL
jgi:glycosyltransferase EpsH